MRRPSRRDTVSTSRRAASSRPSLTPTARATPVGARYSPNTARSASVHSPVVTPALAQAIEAGMTLRSSFAAAASSASAASTAVGVARRAPGLQALDLPALDGGIDGHDRAFAGRQRRGLGLGEGVDADHGLLAGLDGGEALEVRFDQALLHVGRLDRGHRAAHVGDARHLGRSPRPSAPRPCARSRRCRRRCRRIPAGRSRRPRSAAGAATIAGPTAAAGRAPRSTPAAAPSGRARSCSSPRPASRAGCDRRCSPAAAR